MSLIYYDKLPDREHILKEKAMQYGIAVSGMPFSKTLSAQNRKVGLYRCSNIGMEHYRLELHDIFGLQQGTLDGLDSLVSELVPQEHRHGPYILFDEGDLVRNQRVLVDGDKEGVIIRQHYLFHQNISVAYRSREDEISVIECDRKKLTSKADYIGRKELNGAIVPVISVQRPESLIRKFTPAQRMEYDVLEAHFDDKDD
ncbi:MAG: hypothetical protein KKF44_09865 [Nanoarchaeota archaeon]|nr:hypothetical protein [Nanoarchaeota archaeon]